jgi:hypothetical protein
MEIAGFMENESKRIVQVPDTSTLTINFQTAKDEHSRAWILFFWGEREVSIEANYNLTRSGKETLKGSLKADTSWYTGYCGMIECQNKPMPAQQRIETLKYLVSKMLTELSGKIDLVFAEKKVGNSSVTGVADIPVADSSATETKSSSEDK